MMPLRNSSARGRSLNSARRASAFRRTSAYSGNSHARSASCMCTSLIASISSTWRASLSWRSRCGCSRRRNPATVAASYWNASRTWMRRAVASRLTTSFRMASAETESLRKEAASLRYSTTSTDLVKTLRKYMVTSSCSGARGGTPGRHSATHSCTTAAVNDPARRSVFLGRSRSSGSRACTRWCSDSGFTSNRTSWPVLGFICATTAA
mmetsp:Transcript_36209/g.65815  ORF Transcript_36209/g.65815 Transcript_36209/m.65815 type:complete len:209 (+) Transcript_36209:302-928(+)